MANLQGFWSYVRADDEADGGRLVRLAMDVTNQYQMLTGEAITLFLDKVALAWGDNWRDKVDTSLMSVAFFVPVLTPRYFMSPECRRELQVFARRATELGVKELVLPLYYVNVPAIEDKTSGDDLIQLVCTFQWQDWRGLRFLDVTSEGYRRGVASLASRLVEANKRAEEAPPIVVSQVDEVAQGNMDESPGTIDKLANAEETLLGLPETLLPITENVKQIGTIMQGSADDIRKSDSSRRGFAGRLAIARRMATQLEEPTEKIRSLSNEFASKLHSVDEGFRIIIERAPAEIKDNPDAKAGYCEFFGKVRDFAAASRVALTSTQTMVDGIQPLERLSRDLRPVLRRLRQGLTVMVESGKVTDDWVRLIESSGVVCEGADAQASASVP
jgi:hypothetical protein